MAATILLRPKYGESFSPAELNMLVLKRYMQSKQVDVVFMKRRNNGDIIMKTADVPAEDFFGEKKINSVPVTISLPEEMNYLRGIIHHPELAYLDPNDLFDLLEGQVDLVAKPEQAVFAQVFFLRTKFNQLPATIVLGWDRVRVKPRKPTPIRCYKCHVYGHIAADCQKDPVCGHCAGSHVTPDDGFCPGGIKCAACGGDHFAFHPKCPAWQEEEEVTKIKYRDKLSYKDALLKRKQEKEEQDRRNQEEQETPRQEDHGSEEQEEEARQVDTRTKHDDQGARPKRKIDKEADMQETEHQGATAQGKSGLNSDISGGWQTVASRKKKK